MSPDNLSGNILIFVKPEGQDRFKKQTGYSNQLKKLDVKINQLRDELDLIYSVKKKTDSQNSLNEVEVEEQEDLQNYQEIPSPEQFDFITQQQEGKGTLQVLLPSAIENQPSKSYNSEPNFSQSSSQQVGVTSIHNMIGKSNTNEELKILSQNSQQSFKLGDDKNQTSLQSEFPQINEGFTQTSQVSKSIDLYKRKVMNQSLISVKDQFTHIYDMYSKSIASAFHTRDIPKNGKILKKKNPKFLICNSMPNNGIVNSKSEHLMRVYNKEHKPSQINISIPSFPTKKNSQDFILATYMDQYKPIKISKQNAVVDLIPRYLKEYIEKDIKQLNHSLIINAPPAHKQNINSILPTQKSSIDSQPWQKTGVFSDLNKAFVESSQQNSQENLETFNNFFNVSKTKL